MLGCPVRQAGNWNAFCDSHYRKTTLTKGNSINRRRVILLHIFWPCIFTLDEMGSSLLQDLIQESDQISVDGRRAILRMLDRTLTEVGLNDDPVTVYSQLDNLCRSTNDYWSQQLAMWFTRWLHYQGRTWMEFTVKQSRRTMHKDIGTHRVATYSLTMEVEAVTHAVHWLCCPGHTGARGIEKADRLASRVDITAAPLLDTGEVLRDSSKDKLEYHNLTACWREEWRKKWYDLCSTRSTLVLFQGQPWEIY